MATAATSLLGLALPVTGELSGTWGDTVNVSITALLDTAVAGTTTLSADSDVTLTTTTLAANQARQAIILCSGARTGITTITAPAQSKIYTIINSTTGGFAVKIVGVGPTTGVTIAAGTTAVVVWNGVDFVTASVTSTTGILPVANGGTGLSSGTSGGVLAYTATGTLASSAALAASALVIGGGAGAAPSTTTTGTGVVTALGVNTGTAGAFVVNGGALGTPSSGTVTNLTGTASININGTVGATTATTGAFTTVTATQANTSTTLNTTPFVSLVNTGTATLNQLTELKFRSQDGVYNANGVIAALRVSATARNQAFIFCPSNSSGDPTEILRLGESTGAQVTGTLSATGVLSVTAAAVSTIGGFSGTDAPTSMNLRLNRGATQFNGIAFAGAVTYDRGIYLRPSSDTINIGRSAGGVFTDQLSVDGSGNVTVIGSLSGGTSGTGYSFSGSAPATSLTLNSSGNLGVGTATPDAKLTVYGNAPAFTMQTSRSFTVNRNWQIGVDQITEGNWTLTPSTTLGGSTYTTPAITVTPAGNLGLGVTPSAGLAAANYRLFEIGINSGGSLYSGNNQFLIGTGIAWDGGTARYKETGLAPTMYNQQGSQHQFFTAPSGTAGNAISFTQAMTLDASGNLLVGTTSGTGANLDVYESASNDATIRIGNVQNAAVTAIGKQGATSYGATTAGDSFLYSDGFLSIMADNASGVIKFSAGGNTERARIDSSGNLTISNGNLIVGTAGKGIDFSITSSGSGTMTSELLADYEEGTFTPAVTYSGTNTPTYGSQLGRYTKIGRIVQIQIFLSWNESGSTGNLTVTGLPFTSVNAVTRAVPSFLSLGLLVVTSSITGYVENNLTYITLMSNDNTGTIITATNTDNDQDVYITVTYEVA